MTVAKIKTNADAQWDTWDGNIEVTQFWTDEEGNVNHVACVSPPEGTSTVQWGVYGHSSEGGVFWIADFAISQEDEARALATMLESLYVKAKVAEETAA